MREAKKISINEDNIGDEVKDAVIDSLCKLKGGANIFHKGLLLGYFEIELEEFDSNMLISSTSLFPKIFSSIANSLKIFNENLEDGGQKFTLDVDIISTMLPRHYWNFPITHSSIVTEREGEERKSKRIDVPITCRMSFTELYRDWLVDFIEKDNNSNIRRVTLVSDKPEFLKKPRTVISQQLLNTIFFDKDKLEKDILIYLTKDRIDDEGKQLYKESSLKKISIANIDESLSFYKNEQIFESFIQLKNENPSEVENYKSYLFDKTNGTDKVNVFDYFINNLHSKKDGKPEAFFCFLANIDKGRKAKEVKIKLKEQTKEVLPIPVNTLSKITPDYLVFSFRDSNTDLVYQAVLVGKVNLNEGYVKLNYYDADSEASNKRLFEEYIKAYNILLENSYDFNFEKIAPDEKGIVAIVSDEEIENTRLDNLRNKRANK